jgi:DNA replication protein DnaC
MQEIKTMIKDIVNNYKTDGQLSDNIDIIESFKKDYIIQSFGIKYKDCTFDNFIADTKEKQDVLNQCKNYNFKKSLMLVGGAGTGKNHLIVSICRNYDKLYYVIDFEKITDLKMKCISNGQDFQNVLSRYYSCDLLIMPDFCIRGNFTDAQKEALYYIIEERYKNNLPVIIASNLNFNALKKAIDFDSFERVKDRLKEMLGDRILIMNWNSFRK